MLLLTHAGVCFQDPRGRCYLDPLLRLPEGSRQPERVNQLVEPFGRTGLYFSRIACTSWAIHTVSHCCVAQ